MNAERLLQHYEQIADAPDAIARLRRFLLDLAVRGKLVPQDPADEPASELLKRIAAEKAQMGRVDKAKTQIGNEDELGQLPPTWCPVPLIDLGTWAIGSGFPKNEQGLNSGPHFFLKVSDMNLPGNEKFITTANNFIDDEAARRMRARVHPAGTIIFPKIGGAIATNKRRILTRGAAIDNNCLGIKFADEINVEWAFLLLTTLDFTRYQAGTAVPALQQGVLERIPVGLPPLAEQCRIVAKVDELMALCDQLEAARTTREVTRDRLAAASLARLNSPDTETFYNDAHFALDVLPALAARPDQIKQLRQTILNLAVRGKLVPQDPKDEPVLEYLSGISEHTTKTRKLLRPIDPSYCGGELPEAWSWLPLGAMIGNMDAGWSPQCENHPRASEDEWGVLKTTAVQALAFDARQNKLLPTKLKPRPQYQAEVGDILVTRAGPKNRVGISCVVDVPCPKLMISDKLIRFHPLGVLSPRYIALSLNAGYTFNQIENAKSGMAVMQMNISQDKLRAIPIPLPPLAEQDRIVAKVDELMTLCDQLEASLTAADDTRRKLLDALLADALTTVNAEQLQEAAE